METVIRIIFYIWELPQNIVGLLYLLYNVGAERQVRRNRADSPRTVVSKSGCGGSVSLGSHVFISACARVNREATIAHELGHTVQSMYLGPLYLVVIGIPSIAWAGVRRMGFFRDRSYYDFYTESWADRIAGIVR